MAAAATLENADTLTLQRDTDLPAPCGLLVFPELVVLVNRTGALSDIRAYAWHFAQLHNGSPLQAAPGLKMAGFMGREGPVQNEAWREFLAASKASGWTVPPLVPDGFEGMRGDGYLSNLSTEELHERSALARQGQLHIREQAQWRAEPTPDVGEWTGGQVDDKHDDFTRRYIFAFWRLRSCVTSSFRRSGAVPLRVGLLEARPGRRWLSAVRCWHGQGRGSPASAGRGRGRPRRGAAAVPGR
ncbi:hypothetical protein ABZ746_38705 [Streptomyces sp. NPDC020096]